jgi:signal transduction histidine kinase/CheY-like chemotaxis protein
MQAGAAMQPGGSEGTRNRRNAAPARRGRARALACVFVSAWLALTGAGSAEAALDDRLQTLSAARFLRSDDPRPPREGGESLTLPDPWDLRHVDASGYAWYMLDWPLASAPSDLQSIYLSAVTLPAQVFLNDASVGLTGSLTGPRPRAWEQAQQFEVPANVLHPGINRIAVRVRAPRAGVGGLGPIVVGPHAAVTELQMRDLMIHTVGPAIISVIMIVVGVAIVGLWLRRRDASYLLFGLAAIVWGLHTGLTLTPTPLLPQPHWVIWWHAVYMLFVVLLCLFCVRFAGFEWLAYRRFAVAFAVAVPPVLYAANAAGGVATASAYVRLTGIGFVVVALAAVARYALRLRNTESLLLLATGAIATVFAIHDWLADQDPLAIRPVWLVPYSAFAFLILVGWILIDRFVRALIEHERLNADLERRVAAKSASLEFQLAQTREAKEDAETANRAKSRFLAAASHDLRQPLHALGLFAGALPEHTVDAEGAQLAQRIKTTVVSLDALLSALLDISKLDAGVITAEVRDMRLDDLFARLANDFVPEALERDLRLAIVPTRIVVRSDPALLERIVRNLVANALRYTERGGVVVGARHRGDRVAIEVWDSGTGIDAAEREHIFEEFYQIGNPERDRSRGLGLGLAIVRRLADLLGHEVELSSRVGRGSMFRILVTVGNADALPGTVPDRQIAAGSMAGRSVVVIDDEASVREATRDLLTSWGCSVIVAGDPGGALALLDGAMPGALLVDYRLRNGQDGMTAIDSLREALGPNVPAMLVSGESSPAELARIKASGVLLLHKPVQPAKLRAALAFLLVEGRGAPTRAEAGDPGPDSQPGNKSTPP